MGRPRTRLTGALLTLTGCGSPTVEPLPASQRPTPTTTSPSEEPQTHGHRLPQGEQLVLHVGKPAR